MRCSNRERSSTSSMFPVPLNSWKMTSSIRLPVSTRAVAMTVRLPPSSALRAAPNRRRGCSIVRASRPPLKVRPVPGVAALCARARRVRESSRMTTSRPTSTRRRALSSTMRDTDTCCRAMSSEDEAITSPRTLRFMSVTSSGRSSTSSTIRLISGWFLDMEAAIFCRRVVLPARGGATMRQRWPLPRGVSRSMTRIDSSAGSDSSRILSNGSIDVSSVKGLRWANWSGGSPLMVRISTRLLAPATGAPPCAGRPPPCPG